MKNIWTCCFILLISSCYQVKEKTTTSSIGSPTSYRWKERPKTIYLTPSLESDQVDHIYAMASKWNTPVNTALLNTALSSEISVNFQEDFNSIESISTDGHNGVYLVDDTLWPKDSDHALGVTILMGRVNDSRQYIIEEADIIIRKTDYDFKTVVIHELGHLMGLQHRPETSSVMFGSIKKTDKKHTPTSLDLADLTKLYNLKTSGGGVTPQSPSRPVAAGKGQLQRVIIELSADMKCRHLMNGIEVYSHQVDLK